MAWIALLLSFDTRPIVVEPDVFSILSPAAAHRGCARSRHRGGGRGKSLLRRIVPTSAAALWPQKKAAVLAGFAPKKNDRVASESLRNPRSS
jgi:hypothetical protein